MAEPELIEAAACYEARQADLGKRFLASVQDAINNITISPPSLSRSRPRRQTLPVKVFPFGILFRALPDEIVIVAVMHLARHPDYWKHR